MSGLKFFLRPFFRIFFGGGGAGSSSSFGVGGAGNCCDDAYSEGLLMHSAHLTAKRGRSMSSQTGRGANFKGGSSSGRQTEGGNGSGGGQRHAGRGGAGTLVVFPPRGEGGGLLFLRVRVLPPSALTGPHRRPPAPASRWTGTPRRPPPRNASRISSCSTCGAGRLLGGVRVLAHGSIDIVPNRFPSPPPKIKPTNPREVAPPQSPRVVFVPWEVVR